MAQYALPPGAVRRRAAFGLLDADGWTWAAIKAAFWFVLIIFMLGYLPDRAYYFTVSPTIDIGYNAISPINLCPAENDRGDLKLPCPAPAGAIVPWDESPPELALPAGRTGAGTFTSGSNLYLIGGTTGGTATASVLSTSVEEGNFSAWQDGPALPEPRSNAAILNLSGTPYVIGGSDASGAPTSTVFKGTVDQGSLTGWETADNLALPVALTDLQGVSTATSIYVFGGRTADGLSAATYQSKFPEGGTSLGPWTELTELPLPEPRARATAISEGISVYVLGGEGPDGVSDSVFYLGLDTHGDPAVNPDTDRPFGWGVSVGQSASAALPAARADQTTFTNSGAIYVVGGVDSDGQTTATNYWAEPNPTDGTISSWQQLDATDLPAPRADAAPAIVGINVFLIGGQASDQELDSTVRAVLAPAPPFFRLGLFGITLPALSIKGEIGQQLGYIVAGGAGAGALIFLIIIGWSFSHRRETFRFFQWITRGRFRAPPEDEYST